jgi:hypothetical protein
MVSTTLVAGLLLGACATPPQVAHEGDLTVLAGQGVATPTSQVASSDADQPLVQAIQARAASRIAEVGAVPSGSVPARYRLQVTVGTSPAEVGISTADGSQVGVAPWRSAPTRLRPWSRRGPVRTAALAVLDLSSGKVVAWATVRTASDDPVDLADRLVAALKPTET